LNLSDTHCHLDLEKFDADRGDVLARAWQAGLTRILVPGLDLASSQRAVDLAASHPALFAAIGVHPSESLAFQPEMLDVLRALRIGHSAARKIVAIGEIGLDYYWDDAPHAWQRAVLEKQLDLAAELCLPVVLHLREAGDALDGDCSRDMLDILQKWLAYLRAEHHPLARAPGVLHSFSGSLNTAEKLLELNFYIGITGPVTFKNAEVKREVVKSLPLECLLIETDAPFLAPVPLRGRRNEPAFVRHIADKIAEIYNKTPEEVAAQTSVNAARLFSW
jgi:TatD DNase family protein